MSDIVNITVNFPDPIITTVTTDIGPAGQDGSDAGSVVAVATEILLSAVVTVGLAQRSIQEIFTTAEAHSRWILRAGTQATVAGQYRRPDDYNAATNIVYWQRIG